LKYVCTNTRIGSVISCTKQMAKESRWTSVSEAMNSTLVPFVTPALQIQGQTPTPQVPRPAISFASALAGTNNNDELPYPAPCIKGDALSIKIGQDEYQKGVDDCRKVLRARLTLNKGEKSYSARDLNAKIGNIWKTSAGWKMVPLGKGFYDFHFESPEDLKKIWAVGTVNLKPGLLRFSQWTKDFKLLTQKQTHVSLWIRLVELPQEYWRERTLKEIASAVGTPIDIDGPTRNRTFGHYARILVDIDLSKKAYDEVLVEREGYAFKVEIQYERRPLFCHHCYSIGHNITTCRWLHPQAAKEKVDRGKQPAKEAPTTKAGGASTSASGGISTWIPISVNSTVTTTERTAVPVPQMTQAIPVANFAQAQSIPVSLPLVPVSDFMSSSFSLPLHNVFDRIERTEELNSDSPVLEVVSTEAHVDVQGVEERRSPQTSREVLENPVVTDVSKSLLDSVGNIQVSQRELERSPSGFLERDSHSSPLGREDIRPRGEVPMNQTLTEELEVPVVDDESEPLQDGMEHDHVSPRELEQSPKGARESAPCPPIDANVEVMAGIQLQTSTAVVVSHDGTGMPQADGLVLQQQYVHPSKNIQHGLDLWERVREYDARAAAEGFMPVLTKNQKQKVKVQLPKPPTRSRSRGENSRTDQ
jgi:hypothetical protein